MPGKRARHETTQSEKDRKNYRDACSRHVVEFEVDCTEDQARHFFHDANRIRNLGNAITGEFNQRLEQMYRTKEYRGLLQGYGTRKEKISGIEDKIERLTDSQGEDVHEKLENLTKEANQLSEQVKSIETRLSDVQEKHGVTFDDLRAFTESIQERYQVNSIFALTKAESVWQGIESVLYKNGVHLNYHPSGDLPTIKAKQINRGIPLHVDTKIHMLYFTYNKVRYSFKLPKKGKDLFLGDEYEALVNFMLNPGQEDFFVDEFTNTGKLTQAFRPCYCAISCREIRGRLRVFLQVTVAAPAMPKRRADGAPRHKNGKGRCGVDLGTQSYVAVTDSHIDFKNLAERNGVCSKEHEERKRFLRRKLDSSRRASNPERFNKDGTYKKGSKGRWRYSRTYMKYKHRLKELERKDAASRKYSIQENVNALREHADVCIIEPQNAAKLAKRSTKPTEKSDKVKTVTQKDGSTKTVRLNKRKKRFGKSTQHRCPGYFQAQMKLKFGNGYHEVPYKYRASQYDHELNNYIKKSLPQRWHYLPDGKKVQRDIYSAFLLNCADNEFKAISLERCLAEFDKFFVLHEKLIEELIENQIEVCNSGIDIPA